VDTAERLIKSTQELLWERGYVGTSPKAIQQRADAGQGSMYHHFTGKPDLARQAIQRSADELRAAAEQQLGGDGPPLDRIAGYLQRERAVLRGCQIGRLTQDPDVVASPELREPVDETFRWLRGRLAEVIREGQAAGEFSEVLDADDAAATIAAVLQGGYVLARAADSIEPFERAARGLVALLRLPSRPSRATEASRPSQPSRRRADR
jgi:AcrR family transcriptional regulator